MSFVTRQEAEKTRAWIHAFYEAYDSFAVQYWINEFFEPDASVQLGNRPIINGHEDLIRYFEQQCSRFAAMRHTINRIDIQPERIYVHVDIILIMRNDPEQRLIVLKGLVIIGKNTDDDKLTFVNGYVGPAPLLDTIQMYI